MEDNMIINLYLNRSENAINETAIKYGKYCSVIANNITNNLSDTEECVNDTYFKTWTSIPPTIPKILKAYIGKIARNLAINRYEQKSALKRGKGEIELAIEELEECIPGKSSVEESLENSRIMDVVNDFLRELPIEYRDIFVRRYWYTESVKRIAELYNMSESKVKSILFRVRKKLKEKLINEEIYL